MLAADELSHHFQRLASSVDDAAVRYPGDAERYEEEHDALRSAVDVEDRRVDVRHRAVADAAAAMRQAYHVGPEELRTLDDDAQKPAAGDARRRRLGREERAADFLEAHQSATKTDARSYTRSHFDATKA